MYMQIRDCNHAKEKNSILFVGANCNLQFFSAVFFATAMGGGNKCILNVRRTSDESN